jgi:hypothetical protein
VPLVLRRDGDDEEYNDQFSLVGEYYTDGVMNGEAIALLDKRNYALEKISLVWLSKREFEQWEFQNFKIKKVDLKRKGESDYFFSSLSNHKFSLSLFIYRESGHEYRKVVTAESVFKTPFLNLNLPNLPSTNNSSNRDINTSGIRSRIRKQINIGTPASQLVLASHPSPKVGKAHPNSCGNASLGMPP